MKLTDKIHSLKIAFEIRMDSERIIPRFVNVLIITGKHITLIDTGVKDSEIIISDYLRKNGRDISEIKTVILSHSHPDHIGSAARIKKLTGCSILAHPAEKEWIENIDIQNNERPVPGFYNLVNTPVKIDDYLTDNQELSLADRITTKIIHSPGHSKGLVNILFREDKILFTADSIPLKNDIPNYDNYLELMNSLNVIKSNGEYEKLLTSWTLPLSGKEEIYKLICEGEEYMRRIDECVKQNFTNGNDEEMYFCKKTLEKLGLPLFLAIPVVNKAFLSHLADNIT